MFVSAKRSLMWTANVEDADLIIDDGEDRSVRLAVARSKEDLSNLLINHVVFGSKAATLWVR